jgi:hypothetical protein
MRLQTSSNSGSCTPFEKLVVRLPAALITPSRAGRGVSPGSTEVPANGSAQSTDRSPSHPVSRIDSRTSREGIATVSIAYRERAPEIQLNIKWTSYPFCAEMEPAHIFKNKIVIGDAGHIRP